MKFPHFKQLDTMDCGSTCLKMVAQHYGKSFSIPKLRELSYITREGVSMMGISYAAEAIGMHTQGVKLTYKQLRDEATLPVIVHWGQNHFVLFCKVLKEEMESRILDP